MKFSKKIIASNDYGDVEIVIKMDTVHLIKGDSTREFNSLLDKLVEALLNSYYFADIKLS